MTIKELNNLAYEIEFSMIRAIIGKEIHSMIIKSLADHLDADLLIPIEDLNLSLRTYNCLKRENLNTVMDIIVYPMNKLYKVRNMSMKCQEEIEEKIKSLHVVGPKSSGSEDK